MTIEKLPSGSYRITEMYKGKRYRVTVKKKPTKLEAKELIEELTQGKKINKQDMTFEMACNEFFDMKGNIISPATEKGYKSDIRRLSDDFKRMKISEITSTDIQKEINDYCVKKDKDGNEIKRAPKTVANVYGTIKTVLSTFYPDEDYSITLPQKDKVDTYVPTKEEVIKLLEYIKGKPAECAIWLGVCGLRRSEIICITSDDLTDDNLLIINKDRVQGDDKKWHTKKPKTTESIRTIPINQYTADLLREKKVAWPSHPGGILKALNRYQTNLGLPKFTLHALRHYFATEMLSTVGEKNSMYLGGWSTPHVMKKVYAHAAIKQNMDAQRQAIDKLVEAE